MDETRLRRVNPRVTLRLFRLPVDLQFEASACGEVMCQRPEPSSPNLVSQTMSRLAMTRANSQTWE